MVEALEKTCENCKYENENIEGPHCKHCIHNSSDHFEPKIDFIKVKEIRNNAIDEFADELINYCIYADIGKGNEVKMEWVQPITRIREVAEQMKGGAE